MALGQKLLHVAQGLELLSHLLVPRAQCRESKVPGCPWHVHLYGCPAYWQPAPQLHSR